MLYFVAINENENKKEFKLRLTNQYLDGLGNIKIIHVDNKMGYMKYVFSLEFDLNRKYEKDKLTGKDIICPRFQVNGGKTFKRKILLNKIPKKNNYFLYDFEFSENNYLNICQKFNLFKDAFFSKDFNPKYPDNIEREFFWDSMENLIDSNNKFSLKLFLELLDTYYKKNEESNILLKSLENNWDYIFNCEKLDSKYSEILINLEKKFEKEHLRKSVRSINSQNIELFNNLIFIYRTIHEREKIQDMINRESYSGIYAKIIVKKLDFYLSLGLKFPKILIKKLLGQDNLSHVKIIKLLSFGNSVIDIIDIIINNFYKLCNSCIKQKFIIKMTNFNIQKKTDDLEKLISYINQLIEHELKMKYLMVSFNEKFWSFYVNYYKDNNDFKKLKLIEKAILNCKKVDNNLDINKFSNIIHETEIKMIKNGELKNEKILDFFKENYIIGNENTYNIEFPLFFLDGIDLETIDETFFSKWREMNIISYVNSNIYDFCKKITEKINTIDDFGKLFDLFRNNKISAIIIMKNFLALEPGLINILMEKFQNLIKPYDKNKTNKFINYTCLLIDLIDYTNQQNSVHFLNIILKKIDSNEIKNNIIFNLLSKSNFSINLTSFIILYFLRNNNKSDSKIESLIKSKLKGKNNKQIIKFLYDEVNKLIIKEEDIFNEEKSIEFFILLKNIQDITDYQMLAGIGPINNIINLKNKIFFNLKNGNIKYKLIHLWLNDNEKKNLFIERLYILSLNQNEINDCLNSLENYFNQINEDVKITKKINDILKIYFPEQTKNIKFLDNYENELKEGLLNEVNQSLNKQKIDKSNFIKDLDLDEMDKLKISKIFMYIFNNKKESGLIVDGINAFKNAKKDFSKLRELFNYNWEEQNIIEEYTNIIKNMNENELEKELYILKEYFGLKYMNQSDILNLKKDLFLFINKKEEIFKDLNHSFNFIMQLAPKNYEISNIFNNLKDNISKNINLNLIKNYDNLFENFIKNISKKKLNEKTVGIAPKYNYENYENNNKLMNELISEREKNKSLIKKIETLKYKINENNPNQNNNNRVNSSQILVINPGEKIMSFIIMSIDQKINRWYPCKNTDTFVDYEKKLYEEYPEYKEEEYYFTCNGEKIKRFKTIEENKIKDGDKIFMIKYEND